MTRDRRMPGKTRAQEYGVDRVVRGRVAKLASAAASIIGLTAMPIIAAMPAPLMLCTLRPPFECINPHMTGWQYLEGDSPAALVWLSTSLVIAPLMSLIAAWTIGYSRLVWSRALAALAVVPNLLHFVGTYAFPAFHPLVLVLTLVTFVALLLFPDRGTE